MSLQKIILLLCVKFFLVGAVIGQDNIQQAHFEFDHLILFTQSKELEEKLTSSFLTLAEKAGSIHYEQGTEGQYFFFYNTYVELLYIKDSSKVLANSTNFGSDYLNRWNTSKNYCPIGFGLNMAPFDTSLTELEFKTYKSDDSPKGEFYLMSEFNQQLEEPLIYISMPHHSYKPYESIDEVDQRFEEYMRADQKNYLTHPNGVKNLTQIILTVPAGTSSTGNIEILNQLELVKVEKGKKYGLTLTFDNHIQEKELLISNDFELVFKY